MGAKEIKDRVLEGLAVKMRDEDNNRDSLADSVVKGIENLLNNENIDQKTKLLFEHKNGIMAGDAIKEYLERRYKIRDEVFDNARLSHIEVSKSIGGWNVEKIIRFAQAFGINIMESENDAQSIYQKMGSGVVKK